jgi:hypothetical protein
MADNGRWFKLWCSSVHDPDLSNLSIADFGRWAKLGAYIKEHGNGGEIILSPPAITVTAMLQLQTLQDVISCFQNIKNVTVTPVTNANVTCTIKYENWYKYQGDFSGDRVKKFRDKKRESVTPKKRREEKRREDSNAPTEISVDAVVFDGKFMKVTSTIHSELINVYDSALCMSEYPKADLWMFNNPNKRRKRIGQFMANWMENAVKRVKSNGKTTTLFGTGGNYV